MNRQKHHTATDSEWEELHMAFKTKEILNYIRCAKDYEREYMRININRFFPIMLVLYVKRSGKRIVHPARHKVR